MCPTSVSDSPLAPAPEAECRLAGESRFAEWRDEFRIGVDDIDEQHRTLFAIVNGLAEVVCSRSEPDRLSALFRQLEEYAVRHFRDEEMLMAASGYPGLAKHRANHSAFVQVVADTKARHEAGTPPGLEILLFLNAWLIEHIQREDQAAADFYLDRLPPRSWFERIFRRPRER